MELENLDVAEEPVMLIGEVCSVCLQNICLLAPSTFVLSGCSAKLPALSTGAIKKR
jgi:hypothetical protein